jgi:hypothetical protein
MPSKLQNSGCQNIKTQNTTNRVVVCECATNFGPGHWEEVDEGEKSFFHGCFENPGAGSNPAVVKVDHEPKDCTQTFHITTTLPHIETMFAFAKWTLTNEKATDLGFVPVCGASENATTWYPEDSYPQEIVFNPKLFPNLPPCTRDDTYTVRIDLDKREKVTDKLEIMVITGNQAQKTEYSNWIIINETDLTNPPCKEDETRAQAAQDAADAKAKNLMIGVTFAALILIAVLLVGGHQYKKRWVARQPVRESLFVEMYGAHVVDQMVLFSL